MPSDVAVGYTGCDAGVEGAMWSDTVALVLVLVVVAVNIHDKSAGTGRIFCARRTSRSLKMNMSVSRLWVSDSEFGRAVACVLSECEDVVAVAVAGWVLVANELSRAGARGEGAKTSVAICGHAAARFAWGGR